mmetsp:Transcript_37161/g.68820  ORF Transcript_37161/g.68820 Transcript_37161/m.68820 type:complete len:111 (-) Transcript_37161:191-523(-)
MLLIGTILHMDIQSTFCSMWTGSREIDRALVLDVFLMNIGYSGWYEAYSEKLFLADEFIFFGVTAKERASEWSTQPQHRRTLRPNFPLKEEFLQSHRSNFENILRCIGNI